MACYIDKFMVLCSPVFCYMEHGSVFPCFVHECLQIISVHYSKLIAKKNNKVKKKKKTKQFIVLSEVSTVIPSRY